MPFQSKVYEVDHFILYKIVIHKTSMFCKRWTFVLFSCLLMICIVFIILYFKGLILKLVLWVHTFEIQNSNKARASKFWLRKKMETIKLAVKILYFSIKIIQVRSCIRNILCKQLFGMFKSVLTWCTLIFLYYLWCSPFVK